MNGNNKAALPCYIMVDVEKREGKEKEERSRTISHNFGEFQGGRGGWENIEETLFRGHKYNNHAKWWEKDSEKEGEKERKRERESLSDYIVERPVLMIVRYSNSECPELYLAQKCWSNAGEYKSMRQFSHRQKFPVVEMTFSDSIVDRKISLSSSSSRSRSPLTTRYLATNAGNTHLPYHSMREPL